MALSKRHFERVASIIREEAETAKEWNPDVDPTVAAWHTLNAVAGALMDFFAEENPNFDKVRFVKATGLMGAEL